MDTKIKNKLKIGWALPHVNFHIGGVRRACETCNEFVKLGHDVTIYHSDGSDCKGFDNKFKIKSEEQMYDEEMDVIVFTLESDYEKPVRTGVKLKVYYILHYGVLYKHPEICKASYQQKEYLQLANSHWTANHIKEETGCKPQVVHGGINHTMFKNLGLNKPTDRFVVRAYGHPRVWKGREDVKVAIDILREKIPELDFKFFHDMNLTDNQYVEEINKTHIYISGSWFEGWSQCLVPETKIKTNNGWKYIKDVKITDQVYTTEGFNDINKIAKREVNEEIYKIKTVKFGTLKVTGEHPILTLRPKMCVHKHHENKICHSKCKLKNRCLHHQFENYALDWVKAKDLTKNDCLIYPNFQQYKDIDVESIKISDYIDVEVNKEGFIENKFGFKTNDATKTYVELANDIGVTKNQIYFMVNGRENSVNISDRQKIKDYLTKINYKPRKKYNINNKILFDEQFCEFLGTILGDGYISDVRIGVVIDKRKKEFIEFIKSCFKKYFGRYNINPDKRSIINIYINSTTLSKFFKKFVNHGAYEKVIPKLFHKLPTSKKLSLIKGFMETDGYNSNTTCGICLVNKEMIYSLRDIALSIGLTPAVYKKRNKTDIWMNKTNKEYCDIYHLNFCGDDLIRLRKELFDKETTRSRKSFSLIFDWDITNIAIPITKIEKEMYSGFVYNMNVKNKQNYLTEVGFVHNCQLEMFACGTTVVTTKDGGSEDYCIDGVNCIQTEPKQPMEIIEAVMKLYNDRKLMAKLIENGFVTAKKFSWQKSAEELITIFNHNLETNEKT